MYVYAPHTHTHTCRHLVHNREQFIAMTKYYECILRKNAFFKDSVGSWVITDGLHVLIIHQRGGLGQSYNETSTSCFLFHWCSVQTALRTIHCFPLRKTQTTYPPSPNKLKNPKINKTKDAPNNPQAPGTYSFVKPSTV